MLAACHPVPGARYSQKRICPAHLVFGALELPVFKFSRFICLRLIHLPCFFMSALKRSLSITDGLNAREQSRFGVNNSPKDGLHTVYGTNVARCVVSFSISANR